MHTFYGTDKQPSSGVDMGFLTSGHRVIGQPLEESIACKDVLTPLVAVATKLLIDT